MLKTIQETGPDGGTVGLVIPGWRLAGGKTPDDPHFLREFSGLLGYATARAARLEALPAAKGPRPSNQFATTPSNPTPSCARD